MKQKFLVARLNMEGPLHISKGGDDFEGSGELIHSDTLKSALYVCALQLFSPDEFDFENYWDSFQLSSAFPYYKEEYFFPKPFVKLPVDIPPIGGEAKKNKILKKLKYLGQGVFEQVLMGENLEVSPEQLLGNKKFLSEKYQDAADKPIRILGKDLQQRVYVPKAWKAEEQERDGNTYLIQEDLQTFYVEKLYFHQEAGLYILFQNLSSTFKPQLEALLRLLGDNGIGTDRNFGFGRFGFSSLESLELELPEQASNWTNLSLYCPDGESLQNAEINQEILANSAYNLLKRDGWISSPNEEKHNALRKRSIYMFEEGSVFQFGKKQSPLFMGKWVNLRPVAKQDTNEAVDHAIYRDGQAIFIPIIPTSYYA